MTMINIDNLKLDAIAREVQSQLSGATSTNGKSFGLSKCRQIVSQSLFNKPYEEIKNTLLLDDSSEPQHPVDMVHLLEYGSEHILTVNGCYVVCTANGTDLQISHNDIEDRASALASDKNTSVNHVILPQVLCPEEWEYEEVVALAKTMGYFNPQGSIFEQFEKLDTEIFFGGRHCPYDINGDWMGEIENEASDYYERVQDGDEYEKDSYLDTVIWYPELIGGYGGYDGNYELYVTFRELCCANYLNDATNQWSIVTGSDMAIIDFKM